MNHYSAMLMLSLSLLEEFLSRGLTFSSWEEYWWERQTPPPGVLLEGRTRVQEAD